MLRGFLASSRRQNSQVTVFPFTSLQSLIHHYGTNQSCSYQAKQLSRDNGQTQCLETYEGLVQRLQGSCSSGSAKQLHLQVYANGFAGDVFLSNTLLNVYFRTGNLGYARKVFDEMPAKNPVTWACLISGYTRNAMPREACGAFGEMVSEAFVLLTHYAVGSVLRACQDLGPSGLRYGMQIHALVLKPGISLDVLVCNVLISMYGSCSSSADYAFCVFEDTEIKNTVTWNSIISVYSQRGDVVSCFEHFSSMQREGSGLDPKPNEYTFGSLISAACSSNESNRYLLEQMLTRVYRYGFLQDIYVSSALVSGFARLGLLDNATKIFDQMSVRSAVSGNGLMVGLVKQKQGEEAVEVFREMKDMVEINFDSYVVLLSAFPEFDVLDEGIKRGREVHAYLIRNGITNAKIAIGNGLVNMYAKCGLIADACSVFRLMVEKDLVSWNSMISGYDQNECFEDAVISFCKMRKSDLIPSNFTLISALSSCASLGWIMLGSQIHCEGLKLGLDLDISVSNALLPLYADTGYLVECQKLFSLMPNYDQVSWNSIIGGCASSDSAGFKAVDYFLEMMRAGWEASKVSIMSILAAVSTFSLQELGPQLHALLLKFRAADDTAIENALLSCYGKCGQMEDCEKIFARMHERKDEVSWNSMISGYIHNELLNKAMDMVWFMVRKGQRLDSFTFATVLSACASVATLQRGMEVHACEVRACLESDVVVGSAVVDMYSKCGHLDYAWTFFNLMPVRNVYSWNSMISGYARHGHGEKALKLFRQMELEGPQPDHVTYVGVLSACSHVGLVKEGFYHFESMSKLHGLIPRMEHFSCMVDLLGRTGELHKVEGFIDKMPVKPNALIWRTVLGACSRASGRYTELGRRAADVLLESEPQNATNYVLLSNMYASGRKWENVAKSRSLMREAAAKKEAGSSWVTMKDGVHIFVAGDKSHPDNDLIHEKLHDIYRKIKEAGYVPQTKFALYDLDEESREQLLNYHSEKLAIAFVLTRQSSMPIRIMKNLRVCGDCHSAFEYISKIVGRQIILRDSVRFHHFADGECSCGNYW